VEVDARMALEPRHDLLVFVRAVIVHDDVQVAVITILLDNDVQEFDEFLMAVPIEAHPGHLSCQYLERREQAGRAVALVVVGHRATTALLQGKARLRAVQCLYLAFLIDTQNDGLLRRIEIEADHISQLRLEILVVGYLEGPHLMRL